MSTRWTASSKNPDKFWIDPKIRSIDVSRRIFAVLLLKREVSNHSCVRVSVQRVCDSVRACQGATEMQ